jgi:hypothetical protein
VTGAPALSSRSAGAIKYPITGIPNTAPMMPPTIPVVAKMKSLRLSRLEPDMRTS